MVGVSRSRVEPMFHDGRLLSTAARRVLLGLLLLGAVVVWGAHAWAAGRTVGSELNHAPVPTTSHALRTSSGDHAAGTPDGGPWAERIYATSQSPPAAGAAARQVLQRWGCNGLSETDFSQLEYDHSSDVLFDAQCSNSDAQVDVSPGGHSRHVAAGHSAPGPRTGSLVSIYLAQPAT